MDCVIVLVMELNRVRLIHVFKGIRKQSWIVADFNEQVIRCTSDNYAALCMKFYSIALLKLWYFHDKPHGIFKVEKSLTRMPQIGEWREQSHKKFVKFAYTGNSRLKTLCCQVIMRKPYDNPRPPLINFSELQNWECLPAPLFLGSLPYFRDLLILGRK